MPDGREPLGDRPDTSESYDSSPPPLQPGAADPPWPPERGPGGDAALVDSGSPMRRALVVGGITAVLVIVFVIVTVVRG